VRNDLIRCDAVLDPLHERLQCNPIDLRNWGRNQVAVGAVRPGAASAVPHPGEKKQSCKFLCAAQSFLLPLLVVPAVASLTGNQSF